MPRDPAHSLHDSPHIRCVRWSAVVQRKSNEINVRWSCATVLRWCAVVTRKSLILHARWWCGGSAPLSPHTPLYANAPREALRMRNEMEGRGP